MTLNDFIEQLKKHNLEIPIYGFLQFHFKADKLLYITISKTIKNDEPQENELTESKITLDKIL